MYPQLICIGQGIPGCQQHANWVLIYFFHPDRSLQACTVDDVGKILYVGDPQALQTHHVQSWTQDFYSRPAHSLVLSASVSGTPSTQSSELETWKSFFMPSFSPPPHWPSNCQVLKLWNLSHFYIPNALAQKEALIISHFASPGALGMSHLKLKSVSVVISLSHACSSPKCKKESPKTFNSGAYRALKILHLHRACLHLQSYVTLFTFVLYATTNWSLFFLCYLAGVYLY